MVYLFFKVAKITRLKAELRSSSNRQLAKSSVTRYNSKSMYKTILNKAIPEIPNISKHQTAVIVKQAGSIASLNLITTKALWLRRSETIVKIYFQVSKEPLKVILLLWLVVLLKRKGISTKRLSLS